jgi:long-subunit acyl-CoA synthetase (AMP-forming)
MEGATTTAPGQRARPRALDAATMCEAFQLTAAERPEQVALRTIGDTVSITFGEYSQRVRQLAGGLHALGVRRGDPIAFMLTNRPEFHLLDTAAIHLGAIPFSVYNTSSSEQIAYLLGDAGNRVMIAEARFLDRLRGAIEQTESVEALILLDGATPGSITLQELEEASADSGLDFETAWRGVEPDDLLTLIYTSGTTGPPKGVELTHANELAECRGVDAVGQPRAGGSVVSFLPHAHIADRGLSHYGQMVWGHTVTCCPDLTQVFAAVADCHPTFFGAVPRVWEKLKAALEAGIGADDDEARRAASLEAIELGLRKVRAEQRGEPVPDDLSAAYDRAEDRVFSKIRAKLGLERCEWYVIGAAPAPLDVLEFFAAIGIPICEVWGMSELTSIATLVPPGAIRLGTVGPPIPGVEIRLDVAAPARPGEPVVGEILVRGATVMAGYRNQPDRTAETVDADGWLRTGDIGEIDELGYLKVVDRKKELIINAAGKNMSPANIESHLKSASPLIGQAVAIGNGRPYNVALVTLDPDYAPVWAKQNGLDGKPIPELAEEEATQEAIQAAVDEANDKMARVEQIKKFTILPEPWEPGGDELTPTMKLKRKPIDEKYAEEIEALYSG